MLLLDEPAQAEMWRAVLAVITRYDRELGDGSSRAVLPTLSAVETRALVAGFDFMAPVAASAAIDLVARGLREGQVHTPHPRYFGLFNPAPTTMSVAADALVAAFNPQLATYGHAPFAAEVERHLVRAFATRFGFAADDADGVFTSGGAEANTTAMLTALVRAFPAYAEHGARAIGGVPRVYASVEAHHSLEKAARMTGLGSSAVRRVPVDAAMRMRPDALAAAIGRDRAAGDAPFLIVATLGTTSAGAVDPVASVASIAAREKCWLHVDAAWGGGFAAIVPELAPLREGCAEADSITIDAHKSLSVPMGAGMYVSRHAGALGDAFAVSAEYMPRDGSRDPYASSMQWSRRFTGLKLFMSLAAAGWDGYASELRRQIALGARLRERLAAERWIVVNATPLPIVCFCDATRDDGKSGRFLDAMARAVAASDNAWISMTRVTGGRRVLRACVTSLRTREADVDALVGALGQARARFSTRPST